MPELVYDVKFRIDPASAQRVAGAASGVGDGGTASAGQGAEKAAEEVKQLQASVQRADKAVEDFGNQTKKSFGQARTAIRGAGNAAIDLRNKVGTAASRTTKGFSSANQVLFSFSDGINDAAQFSQGFGVGMRAVGNNIGFTIELLTSLNNRVQQHNALVRAGAIQGGKMTTMFGMLRASMAGPGGLLLAVNAVITAITVFTTRSKKAEEEASKLTEELLAQAKAHRELNDVKSKGSQVTRDDIAFLRSSVSSQESYISALEQSNVSTVFGISKAEALKIAREQLDQTTAEITRKEREYSEQKIREAITLGLSADATERDIELKKEANQATVDAISFLTDLTGADMDNKKAMSDMYFEGQNLLAFFKSSTVLTSEQVDVARELQQALLGIADGFSVATKPMTPFVGIGKNVSDVILSINGNAITASWQGFDELGRAAETLSDKPLFSLEQALENVLRPMQDLNDIILDIEAGMGFMDDQLTGGKFVGGWFASRINNVKEQVKETSTDLEKFQKAFTGYTQAFDQVLAAASSLSSARTAENEQEARKQFETQKKLAYASAVVAGAEAVVKAAPNPALMAITAAATAIQLAAISKQQFEYGGGASGGESSSSFGVNVTDTGNQSFSQPSFAPSNNQSDSLAKAVAKGLSGSKFSVEGSKRGMYLFIKDGERQQNETLV